MGGPPAIPSANAKPRHHSISHPEEVSRLCGTIKTPSDAVILEEEEEEENMRMETGNGDILETFNTGVSRLNKSRSLSIHDEKNITTLTETSRALKNPTEQSVSPDDAVEIRKGKREWNRDKSTEKTRPIYSDIITTNVDVKAFIQRLSFQGSEYYNKAKSEKTASVPYPQATRYSGKNYEHGHRLKTGCFLF